MVRYLTGSPEMMSSKTPWNPYSAAIDLAR